MAHDRSTGIIIKNGKILMIFRRKDGQEYYAFPGGKPEPGETPEMAVEREVREETGLTVTKSDYLFSIQEEIIDGVRKNYHYYCEVSEGVPFISGPEKANMSDQNYYEPKWITYEELKTATIVADAEAQKRVFDYLRL